MYVTLHFVDIGYVLRVWMGLINYITWFDDVFIECLTFKNAARVQLCRSISCLFSASHNRAARDIIEWKFDYKTAAHWLNLSSNSRWDFKRLYSSLDLPSSAATVSTRKKDRSEDWLKHWRTLPRNSLKIGKRMSWNEGERRKLRHQLLLLQQNHRQLHKKISRFIPKIMKIFAPSPRFINLSFSYQLSAHH